MRIGRGLLVWLQISTWLTSAVRALSGREVEGYSSPSSLECKRSTLPKASQSSARLSGYYQVPSVCSAGRLTKHIHKTNLTVVAVDDVLGEVYMTCVTGAPGHKITEASKQCQARQGGQYVVRYGRMAEVEGRCIHWVMLDEEVTGGYDLLIKKSQSVSFFVSGSNI